MGNRAELEKDIKLQIQEYQKEIIAVNSRRQQSLFARIGGLLNDDVSKLSAKIDVLEIMCRHLGETSYSGFARHLTKYLHPSPMVATIAVMEALEHGEKTRELFDRAVECINASTSVEMKRFDQK